MPQLFKQNIDFEEQRQFVFGLGINRFDDQLQQVKIYRAYPVAASTGAVLTQRAFPPEHALVTVGV